jgi:hypothetical protein
MAELCKADRHGGSNYNKPHVPVLGKFDGLPRYSCLFCGRCLDASPLPREEPGK